jgi:hypothetical protein
MGSPLTNDGKVNTDACIKLNRANGELAIGIYEGVKDNVKAIGHAIQHPRQTAQGLGNAIVHPINTVKKIKDGYAEEYKRNPNKANGKVMVDAFLVLFGNELTKALPKGTNVLREGTQLAGFFNFSIKQGSRLASFTEKFGKCVEWASEFKKTFQKEITSAGAEMKVMEINIGNNGLIGTATQQLADNGMHRFIEITKDGVSTIYDNFHPKGILKSEYAKEIAGRTADFKPIEGDELLKLAKEVKK